MSAPVLRAGLVVLLVCLSCVIGGRSRHRTTTIVSSGDEGSGFWEGSGYLEGSGSGNGDFHEGDCLYDCLVDIYSEMGSPKFKVCSQPKRISRCFRRCPAHFHRDLDPFNIKPLYLLHILTELFATLYHSGCEIYEEHVPGFDNNVLTCFNNSVVVNNPDTPQHLDSFDCSDSAMLKFLVCSASAPDCEWRNHVEAITSKARKSICFYADDRCIRDSQLYIVDDNCQTYRHELLTQLYNLPSQRAKPVAEGTLFDVHSCGLEHEALAFCPTLR